MANFIVNSFAGTPGTDLTNLPGALGGPWSIQGQYPGSSAVTSGTDLYAQAASYYYATTLAPAPNVILDVDLVVYSANSGDNGSVGFIARANTQLSGTYYWLGATETFIFIFCNFFPTTYLAQAPWTPTAGHTYHMRATLTGSVLTLTITDPSNGDAVVVTCSVTDSTLTGTGAVGLLLTGPRTATTGFHLANFIASAAAPFMVAQPSVYQVYQEQTGVASIPVAGAYSGPISGIEYSLDNTSWSVLDPSPSAGHFAGTIAAVPTGTYTLHLRAAVDHTIATSLGPIGVGLVLVTAGQSQSVGAGASPQPYYPPDSGAFASLYRRDTMDSAGAWAAIVDPTALSTQGNGGSVWPLLGTFLTQKLGYPVAFVIQSYNATPAAYWDPAGAGSGGYYPYLRTACQDVGRVGLILMWVGNSDVVSQTDPAVYRAHLDALFTQLPLDLGYPVRGMVAVLEQVRYQGVTAAMCLPIQNVQRQMRGSPLYTAGGPDLSGMLPDGDGLHFNSTAHLVQAAALWYDALGHYFLNPAGGAGTHSGQMKRGR